MLNQAFFQTELPGLLAAYRTETADPKAQVELVLKHGVFLRAEGDLEPREHCLMVNYKLRDQLRRAVVPYDSIVAVTFAPAEREKNRPGF